MLKKNHGQCLSDTGADEALVKKSRQGDFSIEDELLQRYVFCILRKINFITEDGHFNKEVAMSTLPENSDRDKVEKSVDACKNEKGSTPHESAWLMVKCYHERNPNHPVY